MAVVTPEPRSSVGSTTLTSPSLSPARSSTSRSARSRAAEVGDRDVATGPAGSARERADDRTIARSLTGDGEKETRPFPGEDRTYTECVTPTVLDAVGLDGTGEDGDGSPLARVVSPFGTVPERRLLVEGVGVRDGYEEMTVYDGDRKLVVSRGDDTAVGFALPEETPCELPETMGASIREALPPRPGLGIGGASDGVP